jgi:hypothetical protein
VRRTRQRRLVARFLDYLNEGVWEIWTGFDHILFLCALLPAVLIYRGGSWAGMMQFDEAFGNVVKLVTCVHTGPFEHIEPGGAWIHFVTIAPCRRRPRGY